MKRIHFIIMPFMLASILYASCKKNIVSVLPGNKESAALNFYASTDVMATAYGGRVGSGLVAVYVDQYRERREPLEGSDGIDPGYPTLYFGSTSISSAAPQHPLTKADNSVNYTWSVAGDHTIYFTDIINTPVVEMQTDLYSGSFNTFYLADAPVTDGAEAAYQVLAVQEPRQVPEGKTGVRFIHLSPDAGKLTAGLQQTDGSLAVTGGDAFDFGTATDYQYFDEADTVSGLLRFTLEGSNGISLNTGVPFGAGRSYVVVVKGFVHPQQRRVAMDRDAAGNPLIETVSIGSNLRTDIRRSY